ncbi:hypothetical protein N752_00435 [Desulforamulus aquiferis]|nr:hypothetical protein N752_00435 [Desulforamulus aquiferis]
MLVLGQMYPYAFEDKHMQMLSIIGGQAGIVLANDMLEFRVKTLMAIDVLTGFLNHRQFYRQVVKEFIKANSSGTPISLLLVDIDRLRDFNSRYGHGAGDGLIEMVGSVLRNIPTLGPFRPIWRGRAGGACPWCGSFGCGESRGRNKNRG